MTILAKQNMSIIIAMSMMLGAIEELKQQLEAFSEGGEVQ
jgi:hypothetical protein